MSIELSNDLIIALRSIYRLLISFNFDEFVSGGRDASRIALHYPETRELPRQQDRSKHPTPHTLLRLHHTDGQIPLKAPNP